MNKDEDCLNKLPALVAAINDLMIRNGVVTLEDLHNILGICTTEIGAVGPCDGSSAGVSDTRPTSSSDRTDG